MPEKVGFVHRQSELLRPSAALNSVLTFYVAEEKCRFLDGISYEIIIERFYRKLFVMAVRKPDQIGIISYPDKFPEERANMYMNYEVERARFKIHSRESLH